MSSSPTDAVPADFPTRVWNQLSDCVDAFIAAWDSATDPPVLADFLPPEELAVRRLILSELVKVDLEYRWRERKFPRLLEEYLQEFPEMSEGGRAPVDLVYEEYHVRRQAGDDIEPKAYYQRFPTQETELRRLLKLESPNLTTTMAVGSSKVPADLGGQIDDFDLLTELGRGAFATVHLARQRSMQRLVALKVSADKGDEAPTLAQLEHPNIVRVYDQRHLPARRLRLLYMQYVPGGTLESAHDHLQRLAPAERNGRQYLRAIDQTLDLRGESPPSESSTRDKLASASWPQVICWLGARLATALSHAHHQGVLHRDLKPANVLVAADGNPKLADFNISFASKLDGANATAFFGGSLAYMSPEQLEACNPAHEREPDSLDGHSDVFSLGVMLWELLTGARPFPDERPGADWSAMLTTMVARRTAGVDVHTIRALPADCPPGLRDVLLKCLVCDVAERLSASEAARQFEICLQPRAQQLLYAPRTTVRSFVQQHPAWTTIICIVTIHAIVSVFNIVFNEDELLKQFSRNKSDPLWRLQVVVVNAFAYSIGIGTLLRVAWPVFSGAGARPKPADREQSASVRRHSLRLGDYFAAVGIALWIASGIAFTVWLSAAAPADEASKMSPIMLFLLSQVLFGITASTLSYFMITFLVVRYFYPRLLSRNVAQPHESSQLATLSRRMWTYSILAFLVPIGAVLVWMSFTETNNRVLAAWLGGVGLVGYGLCFWLDRIIREDLAALAQVINPAGSTLAASEATSDSFFSGSRR